MDMRNADWIVGLFMELADPTEEQRREALSLYFAEVDHQLTR
jgi:dsDNA-binding SOS-regulon protein